MKCKPIAEKSEPNGPASEQKSLSFVSFLGRGE